MRTRGKYWKRFAIVFLTLVVCAMLLCAIHAFVLRWLPSQTWYAGDDSFPFVLDEYSWQAIREAFRGLMLGGLIVCAVNAAVAAAWDLSHVFMRMVSAVTGTVVFFPFGWLGFATGL